MATETGADPAAKGEPAAGASPPVVASIVNAETLFEFSFATSATFPAGSMALAKGPAPAANGDPVIALSAPLATSMAYTETLPEALFVT
jgi:hypothetical protein